MACDEADHIVRILTGCDDLHSVALAATVGATIVVCYLPHIVHALDRALALALPGSLWGPGGVLRDTGTRSWADRARADWLRKDGNGSAGPASDWGDCGGDGD